MPSDSHQKTLGIIPARGGSKGVPRKNVRTVAGKPLIAYSIEAGQNSRLVSDIVTSTDDAEIAAVSEQYGCRVVQRPPELARDDSPTIPALQHALSVLEDEGAEYGYIVVLQPTSPLRTAADLDSALRILIDSGADSVLSVYKVEDAHPSRMYRIENGRLAPYTSEPAGRQRHALDPVYHRNGAVYACTRSLLMDYSELIGPDTRPYLMDARRSVNIDAEIDLEFAALLLERSKS